MYKTWRLRCDTCNGALEFKGYAHQLPIFCECTGTYEEITDLDNSSWLVKAPEKPKVAPVARTFTMDPKIILGEIEAADELRWQEHKGG